MQVEALFPVFAISIVACGSAASPPTQAESDEDAQPVVDGGAPLDHVDAGTLGPKGCVDSVTVGHHVYTCDGVKFDVEVPSQCGAPRACGLVIDSHGLTMNAQMEDANTNMRALGAKYGYVVVQPNATDPPISQWDPQADDPALYHFVLDAIDALMIDPKRVHVTGFSDGGETTWRFLCTHADLFASVAPAAANGCTFTGTDAPSREIPVLYMHGTRDALEDFQTVGVAMRDALVAYWKMGEKESIAQGTGYVRTRYTSAKGTAFEFLQHDYAAESFILVGHCFPGSTDPGTQPGQLFPLACVPPNAFNWGEEVMAFFRAHE